MSEKNKKISIERNNTPSLIRGSSKNNIKIPVKNNGNTDNKDPFTFSQKNKVAQSINILNNA